MFDIGLPELLLIAAVTLVVLGPEELPRVMLKIGRFVGSIKRQLGSWQDELERAATEPRDKVPPESKPTAPQMLPHTLPVQIMPTELPAVEPAQPSHDEVKRDGSA